MSRNISRFVHDDILSIVWRCHWHACIRRHLDVDNVLVT